MNKRRWIQVGVAFAVFLICMFGVGPLVQNNLIEPHQPYIIIDPDVTAETGCEYDYLTYIPVEITGRDPSEGVVFPVTEIPEEYAEYVHYPDSWDNPMNPFNPEHELGKKIELVGKILLGIVSVSFLVYLGILWRRGKLKQMKDKLTNE